MKLLDLLLENVKVPFKEKCTIGITNNDGKTVTVNCEVPSTDEEKMVGLMYREKDDDFVITVGCSTITLMVGFGWIT